MSQEHNSLSIDYVSNFQFEKHKASGNNEIYYASLDSVTKKIQLRQ